MQTVQNFLTFSDSKEWLSVAEDPAVDAGGLIPPAAICDHWLNNLSNDGYG